MFCGSHFDDWGTGTNGIGLNRERRGIEGGFKYKLERNIRFSTGALRAKSDGELTSIVVMSIFIAIVAILLGIALESKLVFGIANKLNAFEFEIATILSTGAEVEDGGLANEFSTKVEFLRIRFDAKTTALWASEEGESLG
ncbi:hypothetical protein THII_1683 [Thioploca ingrica]|uniref:Uncharacterized protein n=1 Tax=Thioploca ingrica TaxID=40754 RepID=A0A090ALI4_9GAMM|nr:hypothetical protein THII_1683 [Thioploca ingrica]